MDSEYVHKSIKFGEVVVYRNQASLKWRDHRGIVIGRLHDGRYIVWWVDKRGRMKNGFHEEGSLKVVVAIKSTEDCEEQQGNALQDQEEPSPNPHT